MAAYAGAAMRAGRAPGGGDSAYHASDPRMAGGAMDGIAPILHVADARASADWYARLGFQVESEHTFGPGWPLYVRLRRGPAQLHLSEHRLDGGPVTHVYLYVDDVDSSIPAGAVAEDCPWGMREARLTDPDGNEVRLGSPLRNPGPPEQA
jgi:catechol 2,3-dioxygenase-like lactoylglutathione lyase family enzyme